MDYPCNDCYSRSTDCQKTCSAYLAYLRQSSIKAEIEKLENNLNKPKNEPNQLERYKIGMYQGKKQTQADQIIDRINAELRLENDSCGLKQNALLHKVINIIKEAAK